MVLVKPGKSERPTVIAREFIDKRRMEARERGDESVELVSGEIHRQLGWKSRLPLVCNAMFAAMLDCDEIVHTTPSGKSSTIAVRYFTNPDRMAAQRIVASGKAAAVASGTTNDAGVAEVSGWRAKIEYRVLITVMVSFLSGFLAAWLLFSGRKD